jgi:hypothetical protein
MILHIEKKASVTAPNEKKVRSVIKSLRSYGLSSFATLVDDDGSYVQVAGGGVTCMLEWRDIQTGRHCRAYHDTQSKVFHNGTLLVFGGGRIPMNSNEWFMADKATEVFLAFLNSRKFPDDVRWRDITSVIAEPLGKDRLPGPG